MSAITLHLGHRYGRNGFGLEKMWEDGVRETTRGYVRRLSERFPSLGFEQSMGQL